MKITETTTLNKVGFIIAMAFLIFSIFRAGIEFFNLK